ncbi:hypothetical protein DPMN_055437 [Dreissena polymorpha]|uniref:Uncharacterized protein n=1 Tax=Dreissena polymorpha TaxID=45954 RepID=A0A9D4CRE3_DREPO|nr:hypothetical protein DPMN_055437 [Dreissena polymorpha]
MTGPFSGHRSLTGPVTGDRSGHRRSVLSPVTGYHPRTSQVKLCHRPLTDPVTRHRSPGIAEK